ncbi:hypothetical protein C8R41DRAFT_864503 [Lentinula lateritia]|uniref:Uncharacterized protein n=1 Tax=Lentinula lateritia TaxID=40482 RepID=A0ABQ8VQI8_9AGAR|nr:hypothetical protein C8R41DRAFT_864503 [Lentinula lateritia]
MTEVFKQFFDAREDEFCMPLFESYTTLQSADIQISPNKRRELVLFGAVTALALVYVSSYLPSVSEMLDHWLNMGPLDSIVDFAAHFASYHNFQVRRPQIDWPIPDQKKLGVDNAYFEAFIKGFQLPCSTGVDLVNLLRGGRVIRHNFAGKIFEEVFKDFLTGIGTPCPQLLEDAKSRLSVEVRASLSGLQSPTFRMHLMCWAVTGATRILRDGNPIRIILVEDSDPCYLPATVDPDLRRAYILLGCCSFKTCTWTMRIPVSHLIHLLAQSYDSTTEIKDAQAAVHNWLLIQILESAGAYTTV